MKCFVKVVFPNQESAEHVLGLLATYDKTVENRCSYDPQTHKISGLVDFLHADKDNFIEIDINDDDEINLILKALDYDEIRMIREGSLAGDCLYTSKISLCREFDEVSSKYEGHPVIGPLDDRKLQIRL